MVRMIILVFLLFGLLILPALADEIVTDGFLWTHNAKTPTGQSYLNGFVRGYIEGKRSGLEMMEGTLPYAQFDSSSPIDKKQIESKLLMETLYYSRALDEENLKMTIDLVTEWYHDSQNWKISWSKLVDLAIGKANGFHRNYVRYHLKWLRDVSIHKRIDWFHIIDPTTGEGQLKYYDKDGRIVRIELVK